MRKIVVFNLLTLDGYFARENGDIDWHQVDDEFNSFAIEQTASFGGIIFGKTTYKMFEEYWPARLASVPASQEQRSSQGESVAGRPNELKNPKTSPEDLKIAQTIDDTWKIVFSKSLKEVTWKNSKLYNTIDPEEVRKWKEYEGNDLAIFGSGTIVQQFTNLGLIDEYRFLINPVILGKGKPMFANVEGKIDLKLMSTRVFKNGNVLLTYQNDK